MTDLNGRAALVAATLLLIPEEKKALDACTRFLAAGADWSDEGCREIVELLYLGKTEKGRPARSARGTPPDMDLLPRWRSPMKPWGALD